MYVSGLPYPVTAVLCLSVHCWVPIRVIEYNSVGSCEVNTQPTTTSGEDETEETGVSVEAIN